MKKLTSPFILIKNSLEIFTKKENFLFFVKLYLPLGVLTLLSLGFVYIPFFAKTSGTTLGTVISGTMNVLFAVVSVFVGIAGIIGVAGVLDQKKLIMKDVYNKSFKKFWLFLLLSIVLGLMYAFGALLLLVPFMLFAVWFAFSKYLMVEKGLKIKAALTESKKMVKGMYWKVLIRLIVFGLFCFFSEIILSSIPYVGTVIFYLCGALFIFPTFLLYREIASSKLLNK